MSYSSEVLADSPIRYYHLDETSGAAAVDATGGGNGTYVGSPTLGVSGVVGTAVSSTTGGGYINIPVSGLTTAWSFEFWWKYGGTTGAVIWRDNTSSGGWLMTLANANADLTLRANGTDRVMAGIGTALLGTGPQGDGFHHIVVTSSGTSIVTYINNTAVDTWARTANASTIVSTLRLGRNGSLTGFYNASYDEVAIYGTVVSPTRVTAHYNARLETNPNFAGTGVLSVAAVAIRATTAPFAGSGSYTVLAQDAHTEETTADFGGSGTLTVAIALAPELSFRILDPTQNRAPTVVTVVVNGAYENGMLHFRYDTNPTVVYSIRANQQGALPATAIAVPDTFTAGTHTLHVASTSTVVGNDDLPAEATFTLANDPTTGHVVGPDADPVVIAEAHQPDGTYRWVFQDLMPGGLGSYVLPHNPTSTTRPDFERQLNVTHSTANNGQVHVTEAMNVRYEWKIGGLCFTEAEQDALETWQQLNRRFYLIDDFNEAWVVAATSVEIKPKLRANLSIAGGTAALTDWLADYVMTFTVYERDPHTPVGA